MGNWRKMLELFGGFLKPVKSEWGDLLEPDKKEASGEEEGGYNDGAIVI